MNLRPLSIFGMVDGPERHPELLRLLASSNYPEALLDYLRGGSPALVLTEASGCALAPGHVIPGGSSLLTDGVWAWRFDTIHYLEQHCVVLPADFAQHVMQSAGCPRLLPEDLVSIEQSLLPPWEAASWVLVHGDLDEGSLVHVVNPTASEIDFDERTAFAALSGPQTFVRFDSAARSVRIDNGTKTPQEHQVKRTVEAMEIMREIRRSTGHQ